MAYDRKNDRAAFMGGSPSPWAKSLASIMCDIWIDHRAEGLLLEVCGPTRQPFVLVPKIGQSYLEAVVVHRPKLTTDNIRRLLHAVGFGNMEMLTADWRTFGRAFVHFAVSPHMPNPLLILDHNGTLGGVREFADLERRPLAALHEFDTALGCELVNARHEADRLQRLQGDPPLPRLRDRYDTGCRVLSTGGVVRVDEADFR